MNILHGKFHSHLTFDTDDLDMLQDISKNLKGKLTIIDLINGKHGREHMITNHFLTGYKGHTNSNQIIESLKTMSLGIKNIFNIDTLRIKLEHELYHPKSHPNEIFSSLNNFDYCESHIKLLLKNYDDILPLVDGTDWRLSSNPLSRNDNGTVQFINRRFYDNKNYLDDEIKMMTTQLKSAMIEILEVKVETCVYDSNQDLDAWWVK
jgi:hypothetical protein